MKILAILVLVILGVGCTSPKKDKEFLSQNEAPKMLQKENVSSLEKVRICFKCQGSRGPGGPCYAGPGGPRSTSPGGTCYDGPGGNLYSGPGGAFYAGPGGSCYAGPGGKCYAGPGGNCYKGARNASCPEICRYCVMK